RLSTSCVAIAASMAEPPARSISRPASAAYAFAAEIMWRSARATARECDCDGPSWARRSPRHVGTATRANDATTSAGSARFFRTWLMGGLLSGTIIGRASLWTCDLYIGVVGLAVELDGPAAFPRVP